MRYLQKIKWNSLTLPEKLAIKTQGRPTPTLIREQPAKSRGKTYTRKFHFNTYDQNKWICGCAERNSVFCFPCLLFGGDAAWTKKGITDLGHLSEKVETHELSKPHKYNCISLAMLGSANIVTQIDSAHKQAIIKHNQQVTKNREVL